MYAVLYQLYVVERKSLTQVAAAIDSSRSTVHRMLEQYGIERRSLSESQSYPKHSPETRAKMSQTHIENFATGRTVIWSKGLSQEIDERIANAQYMRGETHYNWKGGMTPENRKIRASTRYRRWRNNVFERDGYACINCGSTHQLEADHIKPFVSHPELRFDVDNGRTLCEDCHQYRTSAQQRGIEDVLSTVR